MISFILVWACPNRNNITFCPDLGTILEYEFKVAHLKWVVSESDFDMFNGSLYFIPWKEPIMKYLSVTNQQLVINASPEAPDGAWSMSWVLYKPPRSMLLNYNEFKNNFRFFIEKLQELIIGRTVWSIPIWSSLNLHKWNGILRYWI